MIDIVSITVRSGSGGNGSGSFRREKYIPKGGPDGGDGGDGGSVTVVADTQRNTLQHFQGAKMFSAENGEHGGKQKMFGKKGNDLEISVPLGTILWEITDNSDPENLVKQKIGEVLHPDDRFVVAKGGIGGRGNVHFKSSTNTTPLEYEIGGQATVKELLLELKLLADVGLVGFPNAGKSTLLSVLTKARPKIANYPFTTLAPHLGVLEAATQDGPVQYVLADIPGLIEQASEGKGLGHQFLRHIERCRLLLYVLFLEDEKLFDPEFTSEQAVASLQEQWKTLRNELSSYNAELASRPTMIAINKKDVMSEEMLEACMVGVREVAGNMAEADVFAISGVTHDGLELLRDRLVARLRDIPRDLRRPEEEEDLDELNLPVFAPEPSASKPRIAYKEKP